MRQAFSELSRVAPPPLEFPALLTVIVGASAAIKDAFSILRQPNPKAIAFRDLLRALCERCIDEYEARAGSIDATGTLEGRLRTNPAWALLNELGARESEKLHPASVATGIELMLSLHNRKPMAAAFCSQARLALETAELAELPLEAVMETPTGEPLPRWVKHTKSRFAGFLAEFDSVPPTPVLPRSFDDRCRTELVSRAAFANYRRRAGVLDDTCFSRRQISIATTYAAAGAFRTVAERRAALWIIGCSGLYAGSTQHIPLAGSTTDDWVVQYDPPTGILRRDLSCLAPDAARARSDVAAPSSFVSATPAPEDVREELLRCAALQKDPRDLGDLIPALRQIQPRDLAYPELSDLPPSLARRSRTLAPYCLQIGMDTLLSALMTGDFGVTARSKVHYCLVNAEEMWRAAETLYLSLGWSKPVPMPTGMLPFGAVVVPREEVLRRIDADLCCDVEKLRPAHRLAHEAQLLAFHNTFVRTLARRLATWLSLREATELSLRATIDERFDLCIDLTEKASAGRIGAMPAVLCDELRSALRNYRRHCTAMLSRLETFAWSGPAVEWLSAVIARDDVPLLCTIASRDRISPVGTDELCRYLPGVDQLARDWGRKFAENYLRLQGAQSRDIDRHQRHEVLGQEQDTSIADGTEVEWVRRLKPSLGAMSNALFHNSLNGLHAGGYAQ